jgi:hypothetical protein
MNLEGVDIFQAETIRRAAKIPAELLRRRRGLISAIGKPPV